MLLAALPGSGSERARGPSRGDWSDSPGLKEEGGMSASVWGTLSSSGGVLGILALVGGVLALLALFVGRAGTARYRPRGGAAPGGTADDPASESPPRPREPRRRAWRFPGAAPDPPAAPPDTSSLERSDGYEGWLDEPPWRGENREPQPYPF
jgi:hypothetical protein